MAVKKASVGLLGDHKIGEKLIMRVINLLTAIGLHQNITQQRVDQSEIEKIKHFFLDFSNFLIIFVSIFGRNCFKAQIIKDFVFNID